MKLVDRILLRADRKGPGNWADMWLPVRTAEARVRHHNRTTRAYGCRCGKPATVLAGTLEMVGRVPLELWSCDEHTEEAGIWVSMPRR